MTKEISKIKRVKAFIEGLPDPLKTEREIAFVPEPSLVGTTSTHDREWKNFKKTVAEDASKKKERRSLLCQHLGLDTKGDNQDEQLLEVMLCIFIPGYSLQVKPPRQWQRLWRGDLEALLLAEVNLFLLDNPGKKASDATRLLAETPFWKKQLIKVSKKREMGTAKDRRRSLNTRISALKQHSLVLFAASLEKNGGFSKDVLKQYWDSIRDAAQASHKATNEAIKR